MSTLKTAGFYFHYVLPGRLSKSLHPGRLMAAPNKLTRTIQVFIYASRDKSFRLTYLWLITMGFCARLHGYVS